ncbi:23S ribosomal RNA methyltransferase Erm [Actinomadura rayongensis]|uniref:23S ribosomal RNA methyltransferase Erm n=1 Tax=Actinomadura rayongensis TaxID=1429076 RepID=A0A6I4W3H9_9ACTN|nr:23S ribosomal RNA methyltransferase Erm [Actinomadura rayongensis]MXQ64737.1 23S ribosomal RNA methyltransferase Erm [Actinomadura rayongensis]
MRTHVQGQHELGQNFLVSREIIDAFVAAVAATSGPIVEIGPGGGALTVPLARLGRPLTAVEIDPRLAGALRRRVPSARVVTGDFLRHRLPDVPHVLAGNLPFHLTTALLRRILRAPDWTAAVLLVQWEVARRRAGVGGASMMTAQWWPWFEFALLRRVPARAFRPAPAVDGGLLTLRRRDRPLVPSRAEYRAFVHAIFTGRGRGVAEIAVRAGLPRRDVARWAREQRVPAGALPKDLDARQWAALFRVAP